MGPMPTVHIIIHPNPHSDTDVALPRLTSPGDQDVANTVVHIVTGIATPNLEAAPSLPSKLFRSLAAAPVLVIAPAPSTPGDIHGLEETLVIQPMTHTDETKSVELRPSDTNPSEPPTAEISSQVVESPESETSPIVAGVGENSGPIGLLREAYVQEKSTTVPGVKDDNTRTTGLSAIVPSTAIKPYQTGIQVPSQARITDGFPYPPGLAAYEILQEDWNEFIAHLTSLIGHPEKKKKKKKKKKGPIRRVLPFGGGAHYEKLDFQKSLSKTFEYVRSSQNNIFRPKGLLVRVDIPGEGVGIESMDLYYGKHVDHLPDTWGIEAVEANAALATDAEEIDDTAEEIVARASVAENSQQPKRGQVKIGKAKDRVNKAQYEINRAKDKTLKKAAKQQRRALSQLDSIQKKMSKRIRIVIEPVTVLENAERSEKNGWTAWIRHCDNYGSQLTN